MCNILRMWQDESQHAHFALIIWFVPKNNSSFVRIKPIYTQEIFQVCGMRKDKLMVSIKLVISNISFNFLRKCIISYFSFLYSYKKIFRIKQPTQTASQLYPFPSARPASALPINWYLYINSIKPTIRSYTIKLHLTYDQ